jgi:branched-chain amino acid transport system substrate-binding protein
MRHRLSGLACAFALALPCVAAGPAQAQDHRIRIGFVTFLSGPAAGPFGVPARLVAEAFVQSLNAGKAPPHSSKGFGGTALELVIIDEAGGATKQVTEYRNLVERSDVDFMIGYIPGGDCLAVAPVAEEMKKLTVLAELRLAQRPDEHEPGQRPPGRGGNGLRRDQAGQRPDHGH